VGQVCGGHVCGVKFVGTSLRRSSLWVKFVGSSLWCQVCGDRFVVSFGGLGHQAHGRIGARSGLGLWVKVCGFRFVG
jgi:hypothetical protein